MTFDNGLIAFVVSLALGGVGWLIKIQSRVQTLEQGQTNLHTDLVDLKSESRGFRESLAKIDKSLEVVIQRLEDLIHRRQ